MYQTTLLSGHLVEDGLMGDSQVLGPLVQCCVLLCVHALLRLQLQQLVDLQEGHCVMSRSIKEIAQQTGSSGPKLKVKGSHATFWNTRLQCSPDQCGH